MLKFISKLDLQYLPQIADFVEKTLKNLGCKNKNLIHDLQLAVDEVSTNIMTHGRTSQKKDHFIIQIHKEKEEIIIQVIDTGNPFPFDTLRPLSKNASVDEKLNYGFGITIIKTVTDESHYQSFLNKNVLSLIKKLPQEGAQHGY